MIQNYKSLNHLEEEESEDEGELTTLAQPYGLTAPKNPTDIPSFEPSGTSTQKNMTFQKAWKICINIFQKLKICF